MSNLPLEFKVGKLTVKLHNNFDNRDSNRNKRDKRGNEFSNKTSRTDSNRQKYYSNKYNDKDSRRYSPQKFKTKNQPQVRKEKYHSRSRSRTYSHSRSKSRSGSKKYHKKHSKESTHEKKDKKHHHHEDRHKSSKSTSLPEPPSIKENYNPPKKPHHNERKDSFKQDEPSLNYNHQNYQQPYDSYKHNINLPKQNIERPPAQPYHQEKEPSNTLMLTNLGPDINKDILEDIFRERCLELQTSMPEDIRLIEELKLAYIIFPSISVCIHVYEGLAGKIFINGNLYDLSYTPNIQQNNSKESVTYVTHLTDANLLTTSMETIVHEDWFCEYCDCKNFSRRVQCFKCKRPKTLNCRIAPVIKQKATITGENGVIPPSTSLMIRGNTLKDSNEGELLEAFSKYGQIKDIRMVKDHMSNNEYRDYAFVEYFTIEEATNALEKMKEQPMSIRGEVIYAAYSKIKRDEFQTQQTKNFVINTSNLSNEDKEKLNNIANLQNQCDLKKEGKDSLPVKKVPTQAKETETTINIRREPTQREKVQMEMRKWSKKMEKKKNQGINFVNNISFPKGDTETFENSEDLNVIPLENMGKKEEVVEVPQEKEKVSINTEKKKMSEVSSKNDVFICYLCERKFPSLEKLKLHEMMSELHKKNLEAKGLAAATQ